LPELAHPVSDAMAMINAALIIGFAFMILLLNVEWKNFRHDSMNGSGTEQ